MTFPDNIVDTLAAGVILLDNVEQVVKRPIRPADPNLTVGIYGDLWHPGGNAPGAGGMHSLGKGDPAVATYTVEVQALTKHLDWTEGRSLAGATAKSVRALVYRDSATRQALAALSENSMGVLERLQRWGISGQRFLNNELNGQHFFLSVTSLWFEVETV